MVTLNVFEGARRVALAIGVVWTLGCLAVAVFSEPYTSFSLAVASPGARPELTEGCGRDDAREYVISEVAPGKSIGVTLCFTAHQADDGRMLVPYENRTEDIRLPDGTIIRNVPTTLSRPELIAKLKANGFDVSKYEFDVSKLGALGGKPWEPQRVRYWRMNSAYSSEVSAYAKGVADKFALAAVERNAAEQRLSDARLKQWREVMQVLFGGLVVGWILTAGIGWIARGFMGIPRGQDRRPVPYSEATREAV